MATENSIFETKLRVENKDVFIDVKKNDNGVYLKISERNRNNRSTILIPSSGINKLRDALAEALTAISNDSNGSSPSVVHSAAPKVTDETKVFVKNLPYDTSSADLCSFFSNAVGSKNVKTAEVILRKNGRSSGSGTVTFANAEAVQKAIAAVNGSTLGERTLVVREYYQNN